MEGAQGTRFIEHPFVRPGAAESRLYQTSIANEARDRNTLVILPTALGKTVISALVTADILYRYRDMRVLVMAPTRPLVAQHRETFTRVLRLREDDTAILTGTTPAEARSSVWDGGARAVFSTPQVARNDLRSGSLNLADYGLLVFDECHRAVKRYAYAEIARRYVGQARYPLILGTTASPGADLDRILEVCENLYIERVEHRTEEDPDVAPYIQSIDMEWRTVRLPEVYLAVKAQVRSVLDERLEWLYRRGIVRYPPRYATRSRLLEAGAALRYTLEESIDEERGGIFTAIVQQSQALTLFHILELLETQGLPTLRAFLEKVELERREKRSYAILTKDPGYVALRELVQKNSLDHPKVALLRSIVEEQLRAKPQSRLIVFTQYRDTASHLVEELSRVDGARVDRFVGQDSKPQDRGLTQQEQAERVRMLEDGSLNVLVATSIAEEGLDIPAVDRVVFYEPIPSEIRYIQRRGRTGRRSPGRVTILAAEDTLDEAYLYSSRRRAEKMKGIVESVNSRLKKILRVRSRPPENHLRPEELKELEEEVSTVPEVVGPQLESVRPIHETLKTESQASKELRREAERTARSLYIKILEKGPSGIGLEQIVDNMEPEGVTRQTILGALERLKKRKLVAEKQGLYTAVSSLKEVKETHDVTVQKVYEGFASVVVDDQWEAILTPEDYDGPRSLVKKNSRFKASAMLYQARGTTYLRVKDVIEILS